MKKLRPKQKRMLYKTLLCTLAVLGCVIVLPGLSGGELPAQSTPAPTATLVPTRQPGAALELLSTPVPSIAPVEDYLTLTQEKLDELEKLLTTDTKERIYESEEEYFGEHYEENLFATLGSFVVNLPTAPPATPVPTATPTVPPTPSPTPTPAPTPSPTPTAVPTATPSPTETPGPEETAQPTPEDTPEPEVTPSPTPTHAPTPSPTPEQSAAPTAVPELTPPPAGPVLTCTDPAYLGYEQIKLYNAWPEEYKQYAYAAAQQAGVSYELVLAIIYNESRFQAGATHLNTNGTTDWGLMQINDVCFSFEQRAIGIQSMEELLDPYKNMAAGCALLRYHMNATGNEDLALLRYQVGEGYYAKLVTEGTPYTKTQQNVLSYRNRYIAAGI